MLTRRDTLIGAACAVAEAGRRMAFGKAAQPSTTVNFDVPHGACDCHTHIFADPAKYPLWSGRGYTPETASPEEMAALHRALRIDRVVIVTPSVYGTDNSATIFGLKASGERARGVAVIDEKTPDRDLDTMERAGIRGIRINLSTAGQNDPAVGRQRFQAAADRVKNRNWHVQINTSLAMISKLKELVRDSSKPVVFDHFGGAVPALGVEQPGFADLVELVRSGKAYVKLSTAYRSTRPDLADVAPLAKALISANPDRMLWGTNWPHPRQTPPGRQAADVTPLQQVDDGRILNLLPTWVSDAATRKKILVDNPARLYRF